MKIYKIILDIIGEKRISEYLTEKTKLVDEDVDNMAWPNAFHKVPELKKWLKRRELLLLKSLTVNDKNIEMVRGQLLENNLYQKMDIPQTAEAKVEEKINVKIPDKKEFLSRWNKEK